jgi:hypothetical protein
MHENLKRLPYKHFTGNFKGLLSTYGLDSSLLIISDMGKPNKVASLACTLMKVGYDYS